MPGRLKVKIIAGRHLPIMDRASDLTDAFVEVKFGSVTHKTDVFAKSLNPRWNSEWFKFEVDDEHLQDEPLQIRVLDHDTYSAHDAIGKVYIDIDPLLDPKFSSSLHGWFPIYDTMHGIRGEILLQVKLELFADTNQFKQSSCGFKFMCATRVPSCYKVTAIHGFVHELLVNEDPEYQWIDRLRTPRASNEARQRLFSKMSGELQRRIGSKVESVGGNAVLGFQQSFDIEGDYGIVVRGIGTAVSIDIVKDNRNSVPQRLNTAQNTPVTMTSNEAAYEISDLVTEKVEAQVHIPLHDMLKDFPFYTLRTYPSDFVVRLSLMVTAHSVKLLDKMHSQEELETRELWWRELRQEMKSHCLALGCNAVIGYSEQTSIRDEVIVLSAQGSAAVMDTSYFHQHEFVGECYQSEQYSNAPASPLSECNTKNAIKPSRIDIFRAPLQLSGQVCPMQFQPSPVNPDILVPEILFSTIDIPSNIHCVGKSTVIQARYCRSKKKSQGETNAALVSDILPFIEYELHKQLYNKLKLRCMNAVFGLQTSITLGENLVLGVATGTAVYLEALPYPEPYCMSESSNRSSLDASVEKRCVDFTSACKTTFGTYPKTTSSEEKESLIAEKLGENLDVSLDGKHSLAVGIADVDDELETLSYLEDLLPPCNCHLSTLDCCPGVPEICQLVQTFSLLRRVKYDDDAEDSALNDGLRRSCEEALAGVWFRLRMKSLECHIRSLRFRFVLPDDDELQIWITGSAVTSTSAANEISPEKRISSDCRPLTGSDPGSTSSGVGTSKTRQRQSSVESASDDVVQSSGSVGEQRTHDSPIMRRTRATVRKFKRSSSTGSRFRHDSSSGGRSRHHSESGGQGWAALDFGREIGDEHADLVPMSCVPGHVTVAHIGILNIFIIRETTAVRGSDEEITIGEPPNGTGCSWFVTRSLAETNALIRAHVVAIGGNALTSYRTSYCVLKESLTKNEAQTLLHVTGDVVIVNTL